MPTVRCLAASGARSIALSIALAACHTDRLTSADQVPTAVAAPSLAVTPTAPATAGVTSKPQFLQPAAGAPTIANPVVRFWAKVGQNTTAAM